MSFSQVENIKNSVRSAGYGLRLLQSSSSKRELEQYRINNTSIVLEIHIFKSSTDAIAAVAEHVSPLADFYFRQVAIAKLWVVLKGNMSDKELIDNLMSRIVTNA